MESLKQASRSRNYGMDILKFLAMVYVIVIHTYNAGGIYYVSHGLNKVSAASALALVTVATDIFALTTGYVSYTDTPRPFNRKKVFDMWLQVLFYGLAVTLACLFIIPEKIGLADFFTACFPIFNDEYWYFTAFFLVNLVSPLVLSAVRHVPESALKKLAILIVLLFSFYATFVAGKEKIVFQQSFAWILILYFLGAVIRKCRIGEKIKAYRLWLVIVICIVMTVLWHFLMPEIAVGRAEWHYYQLHDNTSPTVLIPAICYVILFSRIKAGNRLRKFSEFFAPCVFAAYLLNTQPLVYNEILMMRFAPLAGINPPVVFVIVFLYAAAFVVIACLLDKVRLALYKLFRINRLVDLLVRISDRLIQAVDIAGEKKD